MSAKRRIVVFLEDACEHTHWFTHRRPWLWLPFRICPLANLSSALDERWGTGVWETVRPELTHITFYVCERCGSMLPETDMGRVGDDWYCHPSTSNGTTCYQRETWVSA
jgi:hypothetical protein